MRSNLLFSAFFALIKAVIVIKHIFGFRKSSSYAFMFSFGKMFVCIPSSFARSYVFIQMKSTKTLMDYSALYGNWVSLGERDVCGLDMARDRLQAFRLVPLELPQVEGKFMQEPFEGRREKINNFQDENSLDGGSIKLYLFLCWLLVKQNEKKAWGEIH